MSTVRIAEYPDLRKVGRGIINVNDQAYRRALEQKRVDAENRRLRNRVDALERQMQEILAALKGP